jgi:RNA-binding protein
MPPRTIKDVKRVGHGLRPTVHVGKEGVTDTLIDEISKQVKARKVVKVRLLPSVEEDRKQVAEDLADRSNSVLIEVVGHTILLWERKYLDGKGDIDC